MFAQQIVENYNTRLCQQHVVIAASATSRTCLHIVYIKVERIKFRRSMPLNFRSYIAFAASDPLFGLA
jgi:hypothetical protein